MGFDWGNSAWDCIARHLNQEADERKGYSRPLQFYGEHEKDVQTVKSSISQEALHSEPVPMVCYGKLELKKQKMEQNFFWGENPHSVRWSTLLKHDRHKGTCADSFP